MSGLNLGLFLSTTFAVAVGGALLERLDFDSPIFFFNDDALDRLAPLGLLAGAAFEEGEEYVSYRVDQRSFDGVSRKLAKQAELTSSWTGRLVLLTERSPTTGGAHGWYVFDLCRYCFACVYGNNGVESLPILFDRQRVFVG